MKVWCNQNCIACQIAVNLEDGRPGRGPYLNPRIAKMRWKLRFSLIAVMIALSIGILPAPALEQNSNADSKPIDSKPPESRLVDIGGGRRIYLVCEGTGSPTVVFVSGRSDRSDIWQTLKDANKKGPAVYSAVAKFTRVCAYGLVIDSIREIVADVRASCLDF